MYHLPRTLEVTIPINTPTSSAFQLRERVLAGIYTPSALTSDSFTLHACDDEDGTYVPVYDSDGNPVAIPVATNAARAVALTSVEGDAAAPWRWLKLVGNQNEAAARTLVLSLK